MPFAPGGGCLEKDWCQCPSFGKRLRVRQGRDTLGRAGRASWPSVRQCGLDFLPLLEPRPCRPHPESPGTWPGTGQVALGPSLPGSGFPLPPPTWAAHLGCSARHFCSCPTLAPLFQPPNGEWENRSHLRHLGGEQEALKT